MSESKETQNISIGIDFKNLGATKTVKWVVIVAISVVATMETIFWTKMLMAKLGWGEEGEGEGEEEEEKKNEDGVKDERKEGENQAKSE